MSTFPNINTTTGLNSKDVNARDISINVINARDINATANAPPAKKRRIWKLFCTVPSPTPNFVGREDLIDTIHHQLKKCALEREYSKKIVVIKGQRGMGKSELVRRYVKTYPEQNSFILNNAAWIDAQSRNSLRRSFKSLAEELHLQTKGKEVDELASSIYKHLVEKNQPSLFIFDNAKQTSIEDKVFGIFEFLPTVHLDTIPLIVITTRVNNLEIRENSENIIQINELSEDAAVEFLTKRFKIQKPGKTIMDALKNLAQNLRCFPLGLTLAASNIPHKVCRIPKEIEIYIHKLNNSHESWIQERHSAETANPYDLIMDNVWAATLKKLKSHGDIGTAAISILNIIAYLPAEEIAVEKVEKVAKYFDLSDKTIYSGLEMLDEVSLISLRSSTNDDTDSENKRSDSSGNDDCDGERDDSANEENNNVDESDQYIRIHRLVQRCTRYKLHFEENYTFLLNISKCLAHHNDYVFDQRAIHQLLKERKWPEKSIQFSVLFASSCLNIECTFNIVKDVHEALVLEEKPNYAQNLTEDYKILHALNLLYVSTSYRVNNKLWEDLLSKDPSYSRNYLTQQFVSSLGKCVQGLFFGTINMEDLVKRASINVLIRTFTKIGSSLSLSKEDQKEIQSMLADTIRNPFRGDVNIVGLLYSLLKIVFCFLEPNSISLYVESVLTIHGDVYSRITETGGDRLDSYWENDKPIPYLHILLELRYSRSDEINPCIVESFRTEACLQFLLDHLKYLDAHTNTTIGTVRDNAKNVLEFIMLLGLQWDCAKEFVQVYPFMETLYNITTNFFKLNGNYFYKFRCLLTWFGLFGKNTYVGRNGVGWSIQSVEKEMKLFLDNLDWAGRADPFFRNTIWEGDAVLKEFIKTSGSDQESVVMKTAIRMLEYLKSTILYSMSGL